MGCEGRVGTHPAPKPDGAAASDARVCAAVQACMSIPVAKDNQDVNHARAIMLSFAQKCRLARTQYEGRLIQ